MSRESRVEPGGNGVTPVKRSGRHFTPGSKKPGVRRPASSRPAARVPEGVSQP